MIIKHGSVTMLYQIIQRTWR